MEVNDYKELQKGSIKIGIPPMIGAYLFPKIFSGFQLHYPHLDIYLYEEGSVSIREQLERDELDFGIVIISGASSSLKSLPITTSEVIACLPEKSTLANKKKLNVADLKGIDLIMLKEGSFLRQMILRTLKDANIKPNIVLESNQVVTIKGLVASGVGIAFLLDFVLEEAPGIKAVPLGQPLIVDVGLAWKKDRYISKAAQSFIDFCQDTLKRQ